MLGLPLFYESFCYLVFHWIVLATSWNILSGYSGYFSFGHGAFFGAGMYTTATLASRFDVPFLWTLPAAALVAIVLAVALGAVVFRVKGRARRALRAGHARVHVRRRHHHPQHADRRWARRLPECGAVAEDRAVAGVDVSILLGLFAALATVAIAYAIYRSRLGVGLFAIHDDEDVAEVLGVPTFRCKMLAFAASCGWLRSPAASTRCSSPT
jgi:branched-chain amino acid transport system permease protein